MSDTVHPEIIELARRIAAAHGLEPALVCAVIEQESAWNPWAVRYEPGFLSRYVAPCIRQEAERHGSLHALDVVGLDAGDGQVAREFGFAGDSLPELCDPRRRWNSAAGPRQTNARSRGDVPAALLAWNGGADPNYPLRFRSHAKLLLEIRAVGKYDADHSSPYDRCR